MRNAATFEALQLPDVVAHGRPAHEVRNAFPLDHAPEHRAVQVVAALGACNPRKVAEAETPPGRGQPRASLGQDPCETVKDAAWLGVPEAFAAVHEQTDRRPCRGSRGGHSRGRHGLFRGQLLIAGELHGRDHAEGLRCNSLPGRGSGGRTTSIGCQGRWHSADEGGNDGRRRNCGLEAVSGQSWHRLGTGSAELPPSPATATPLRGWGSRRCLNCSAELLEGPALQHHLQESLAVLREPKLFPPGRPTRSGPTGNQQAVCQQ
mmetsp:Transcript_86154/g.271698  ORF Transcript_86154/g.271698 Transcript_86154/m.271698 type:complete len:263 (-) Transcript_86154:16-804(-)